MPVLSENEMIFLWGSLLNSLSIKLLGMYLFLNLYAISQACSLHNWSGVNGLSSKSIILGKKLEAPSVCLSFLYRTLLSIILFFLVVDTLFKARENKSFF